MVACEVGVDGGDGGRSSRWSVCRGGGWGGVTGESFVLGSSVAGPLVGALRTIENGNCLLDAVLASKEAHGDAVHIGGMRYGREHITQLRFELLDLVEQHARDGVGHIYTRPAMRALSLGEFIREVFGCSVAAYVAYGRRMSCGKDGVRFMPLDTIMLLALAMFDRSSYVVRCAADGHRLLRYEPPNARATTVVLFQGSVTDVGHFLGYSRDEDESSADDEDEEEAWSEEEECSETEAWDDEEATAGLGLLRKARSLLVEEGLAHDCASKLRDYQAAEGLELVQCSELGGGAERDPCPPPVEQGGWRKELPKEPLGPRLPVLQGGGGKKRGAVTRSPPAGRPRPSASVQVARGPERTDTTTSDLPTTAHGPERTDTTTATVPTKRWRAVDGG